MIGTASEYRFKYRILSAIQAKQYLRYNGYCNAINDLDLVIQAKILDAVLTNKEQILIGPELGYKPGKISKDLKGIIDELKLKGYKISTIVISDIFYIKLMW